MAPHQRPMPTTDPTTPKPKKSRLRWLAVFSSVLLLAGYIGYRVVVPVFIMAGTKSSQTFTQVTPPALPGGTTLTTATSK